MESYLPKPSGTTVAAVDEQEEDVTVAATSAQDKLVHVVEKLVERVENWKQLTNVQQVTKSRRVRRPMINTEGPTRDQPTRDQHHEKKD